MNQQWIELVPSYPTLTEYWAFSKSIETCIGRYMVRPFKMMQPALPHTCRSWLQIITSLHDHSPEELLPDWMCRSGYIPFQKFCLDWSGLVGHGLAWSGMVGEPSWGDGRSFINFFITQEYFIEGRVSIVCYCDKIGLNG